MTDPTTLVRGVSPVLEVPFTGEGAVDVDGFQRVVANVLGTGVASVMFPGFASEFYKLTDEERGLLRDVLLVRTRHRPDVAAIIAIQDHATYSAVRRAVDAVEAGADLVNLLPPRFLAPRAAAVDAHIRAVVGAVAPTPVVLQHAPGLTGVSLDAGSIAAIARDHPNLRVVKVESSPPGALIAELAEATPSLPALVGYAGLHLPDAVRRGAAGVQPGCSFTEIYQALWSGLKSGEDTTAQHLYRRLLPYLSYWMQDVELIIAAEKLISVRRGWFSSPHCRAPSYRLDAEETRMVEYFLTEFGAYLTPGRHEHMTTGDQHHSATVRDDGRYEGDRV